MALLVIDVNTLFAAAMAYSHFQNMNAYMHIQVNKRLWIAYWFSDMPNTPVIIKFIYKGVKRPNEVHEPHNVPT